MGDRPGKRALDKYLKQIDVWALSLGCIIGWGSFVMPGTTFLPLAGPGGTLLAMLISMAVTLVILYNYFTLMKRYPGTGGVYSYCKEEFGRDHAFLSAWFLCLSYVSLIPQNATVLALICRILAGDRFHHTIHYQAAGSEVYLAEVIIAIGALFLIGIFAICTKPFLQWVQTVLGLVIVFGIVLIGIMVIPHIRFQDLFTVSGTMGRSPLRGVLSIFILAPWIFVGFEVVSLETAHFRFPVKKSGRLITLAVIVGGLIYSVLVVAAISRQPVGFAGWQDYIDHLDRFTDLTSIPTFYALKDTMGGWGLVIVAATAFAAVISSIIGFYRASARILMNMASDHILADTFNKPSACFLFLMGISALISLFGRTAISWVVDLSSFGAIVGFGYVSAVVFKRAGKQGGRIERVAGLFGIILASAFSAAQLIPGISLIETMKAESYLILAIWCLAGFAFYWRTMAVDAQDQKRNESITAAGLFFLLILAIVIWYIKKTIPAGRASGGAIISSTILLLFILLGLIVMLMIQNQLKKKQMLLETEKIRAIENSQAKSRFLFNMSHDIRTPMNAVIGYVNLALKEPLSPELRDYLEKIDLSSHHMMALINDILEMSRIESGKLELNEVLIDMEAIITDIYHLFAEQMKEKGLSFEIRRDLSSETLIYCDKNNLTRMLINLISNAYNFTPEGGRVEFSVLELNKGAEAGDRRTYRFVVKDTGIGMSKEFADRMFTAFERERTSTDSGVNGTGLGLAISKSILDLMGGTIEVKTAPGKGTELILEIGFRPAESGEVLKEEGTDECPEPAGDQARAVDHSKKRLLLVEDNAINLEIAVMILSQAGYMLESAENGQIAVNMILEAEAGYYDAVLMDIQMPVMDGYTATRLIRSLEDPDKSKIPVIAMTANAFNEDMNNAFEAGMQAHIAKPIEPEVMLSTIDKVLCSQNQRHSPEHSL